MSRSITHGASFGCWRTRTCATLISTRSTRRSMDWNARSGRLGGLPRRLRTCHASTMATRYSCSSAAASGARGTRRTPRTRRRRAPRSRRQPHAASDAEKTADCFGHLTSTRTRVFLVRYCTGYDSLL